MILYAPRAAKRHTVYRMPSIYSRHQTILPPSSMRGKKLPWPSSRSSLSSEYRRSIRRTSAKGSGQTSIVSSQRSTNYESIRSSSFMIRSDQGKGFLSSLKMSFEEENPAMSRDPPETTNAGDTCDDWGYFVDCDYNVYEQKYLPPLLLLPRTVGTVTIPEQM
jgi:hypothetical protein